MISGVVYNHLLLLVVLSLIIQSRATSHLSRVESDLSQSSFCGETVKSFSNGGPETSHCPSKTAGAKDHFIKANDIAFAQNMIISEKIITDKSNFERGLNASRWAELSVCGPDALFCNGTYSGVSAYLGAQLQHYAQAIFISPQTWVNETTTLPHCKEEPLPFYSLSQKYDCTHDADLDELKSRWKLYEDPADNHTLIGEVSLAHTLHPLKGLNMTADPSTWKLESSLFDMKRLTQFGNFSNSQYFMWNCDSRGADSSRTSLCVTDSGQLLFNQSDIDVQRQMEIYLEGLISSDVFAGFSFASFEELSPSFVLPLLQRVKNIDANLIVYADISAVDNIHNVPESTESSLVDMVVSTFMQHILVPSLNGDLIDLGYSLQTIHEKLNLFRCVHVVDSKELGRALTLLDDDWHTLYTVLGLQLFVPGQARLLQDFLWQVPNPWLVNNNHFEFNDEIFDKYNGLPPSWMLGYSPKTQSYNTIMASAYLQLIQMSHLMDNLEERAQKYSSRKTSRELNVLKITADVIVLSRDEYYFMVISKDENSSFSIPINVDLPDGVVFVGMTVETLAFEYTYVSDSKITLNRKPGKGPTIFFCRDQYMFSEEKPHTVNHGVFKEGVLATDFPSSFINNANNAATKKGGAMDWWILPRTSVSKQSTSAKAQTNITAVYRALTDRFASPSGEKCKDLSMFCGGTYSGLLEHAHHISSMGFDTLYISPFFTQTKGPSGDGYHGFWQRNLEEAETRFGTFEQLYEMQSALEEYGIGLFPDTVYNHMGYEEDGRLPAYTETALSNYTPFSGSIYYHRQCSDEFLYGYMFNYYFDTICWMSGLPDLNQTVPFVRDYLIHNTTKKYKALKPKAIRMDAARNIDQSFLLDLYTTHDDTWFTGEYIFDNEVESLRISTQFGPIHQKSGFENYIVNSILSNFFLKQLPVEGILGKWRVSSSDFDFYNSINFIDSHDTKRFYALVQDNTLVAAATALIYFFPGTPLVFYGTERPLNGTTEDEIRQPLWETGWSPGNLTQLLTVLNKERRAFLEKDLFYSPMVIVYMTEDVLVYRRGVSVIVAVSLDIDREKGEVIKINVPVEDGVIYYNVLASGETLVPYNGNAEMSFRYGAPKVFVQSSDNFNDKTLASLLFVWLCPALAIFLSTLLIWLVISKDMSTNFIASAIFNNIQHQLAKFEDTSKE
eukprot:Nk52_evm34s232 gene=Nk52_evmTU34s232